LSDDADQDNVNEVDVMLLVARPDGVDGDVVSGHAALEAEIVDVAEALPAASSADTPSV
jgi:hypothetical protein